jgi:hypothetical protein
MTLKARILVRTTVDWAGMTAEAFRNQTDPYRPEIFVYHAVHHDLPGKFRQAFGVDYFAYRHELQRIARGSYEHAIGCELSIGFGDFEQWFNDDADEFVFTTDDDDLFAPHLASATASVDADTAILVWPPVMFGFVEFRPPMTVERHYYPMLFTNNWAVRKSFLREHFEPEQARRFLAYHDVAQAETMRLLGIQRRLDLADGRFSPLFHHRVLPILDALSVEYMHPGSLHIFNTLGEGRLADYDPTIPIPVPEYVSWAAGYLENMRTAIHRLRR